MSAHLIPQRETETIQHIRAHNGARALRQHSDEWGDVIDLLARPEWFEQAKCRGVGADKSHPKSGGYPGMSETRIFIRKHCDHCTVRRQCLDWALKHEASAGVHGVYGGTTPDERRQMLRVRRGAKPLTDRERRAVEMFRHGHTVKEIAERMSVHERTVQYWVRGVR